MTPDVEVSAAGNTGSDLAAALAAEFERLDRRHAEISIARVAAPWIPLRSWTDIAQREAAFLWQPAEHAGHFALGQLASCQALGGDRSLALREQARSLLRRSAWRGDWAPRLYGGLSFVPGDSDHPWRSFPDARFVLPRVSYQQHGDHCALTLALTRSELRQQRGRWLESVARCWQQAAAASGSSSDRECPGAAGRDTAGGRQSGGARARAPDAVRVLESDLESSAAEYQVRVADALQAIEVGRFDKVVAARALNLRVADLPSRRAALERLAAIAPTAVKFLIRPPRRTTNTGSPEVFLGATPELLFEKCGRRLRSAALAGSSTEDGAAALTQSEKDRREHAWVTQALRERLESVATEVRVGACETTRAGGGLVHLQTPLSAELRRDCHPFDLVARLHPTPAVGGTPAEAALEFIRSSEPFARGWYSGPIGWVDAHGDAVFAVALRCGLVRADWVHLFAGAGIVDGSLPEREARETTLKLRPLAEALGIEL